MLFFTGIFGMITGMKRIRNGRLAKPYDLVFGVVFALSGLSLVVLDIFTGSSQYKGASTYALIYAFFGLTALYRGVRAARRHRGDKECRAIALGGGAPWLVWSAALDRDAAGGVSLHARAAASFAAVARLRGAFV